MFYNLGARTLDRDVPHVFHNYLRSVVSLAVWLRRVLAITEEAVFPSEMTDGNFI